MKSLSVILVIAALCAPVVPQTPDYIKPCSMKSGDFKKCALESAQYAIPFIIKGDRALNIPKLQPLKLPLIEVEHHNFKLSLKDAQIDGLGDIQIKSLNRLDRTGFDAVFHIPRVNIVATYVMDGKVLLLNLEGTGPANITGVEGDYHVTAPITPYDKDGVGYLRFEKPVVDFTLTRAYFEFGNLFNGNERLGPEVNQLLNENWQDVLKDLGAPIKETVATIISSIVTKILDKIPEKNVFP